MSIDFFFLFFLDMENISMIHVIRRCDMMSLGYLKPEESVALSGPSTHIVR